MLAEAIAPICHDNEAWLLRECPNVLNRAVELENDAIEVVAACVNTPDRVGAYQRSALHFFAYHVLLPGSYSIVLNLLAGGLPSCFRELRFMTEMAAWCCLADSEFADVQGSKDQAAFHAKLDALETHYKRAGSVVKRFDEHAGLEGTALALWKELSEELHGKRYVERLVKSVAQRQNMPSYGLVIPYPYVPEDKPDLLELREYMERFREIVRALPFPTAPPQ